jgi:hypothetical protein
MHEYLQRLLATYRCHSEPTKGLPFELAMSMSADLAANMAIGRFN